MSRIYFTTHDAEVELSGAERAYMSCWLNRVGLLALGLYGDSSFAVDAAKDLLPFIDPSSYLHRDYSDEDELVRHMQTHFVAGDPETTEFTVDGDSIGVWQVFSNTGMVMGDQVMLMARLHAQCECHCYIEEENREWVADIIDKGREKGIYRPDMGWESVAELLRGDNEGIVVTSYSVCDTFPHPYIANFDEEYDDQWYELSSDKRWELGVAGLQSDEKWKGLEIQPDHGVYFGNGLNAFQLRQKAIELQRKEG